MKTFNKRFYFSFYISFLSFSYFYPLILFVFFIFTFLIVDLLIYSPTIYNITLEHYYENNTRD